ncbi:MAG: hypothetical protein LC667_12080 [Thioalkalivibrio sp.]|nr:hypothetical protein [Thioalkalivibrio sp.]
MPDRDGNGRVLAFLTGGGGPFGGYTSVSSYPRSDCGSAGVQGEAFYLNVKIGLDESEDPTVLHEVAHIADLGWNLDRLGNPIWSIEGFAKTVQTLWTMRGATNPLLANQAEPPSHIVNGSGPTWMCWLPRHIGISAINAAGHDLLVYNSGCQQVTYILARYATETGSTTAQAVKRWSELDTRSDFPAFYAAMLGTDVSRASVWAEYLLSWYADDYVNGTIDALQERTWNLRALYASGPFAQPFPLPDVAVPPNGGTLALILSVPDVRHIEFTSTAGTRVLYVSPSGQGLQNPSTDLAILRVR